MQEWAWKAEKPGWGGRRESAINVATKMLAQVNDGMMPFEHLKRERQILESDLASFESGRIEHSQVLVIGEVGRWANQRMQYSQFTSFLIKLEARKSRQLWFVYEAFKFYVATTVGASCFLYLLKKQRLEEVGPGKLLNQSRRWSQNWRTQRGRTASVLIGQVERRLRVLRTNRSYCYSRCTILTQPAGVGLSQLSPCQSHRAPNRGSRFAVYKFQPKLGS